MAAGSWEKCGCFEELQTDATFMVLYVSKHSEPESKVLQSFINETRFYINSTMENCEEVYYV